MELRTLYRYTALVLGLTLGVFLSLFAFDSFPKHGTWNEIEGFLIEMSPALIVILTSIIGFRKPKNGLVIFLVITIAFTFYFHTYRHLQNFMVISFPPLVISLFLFASSREPEKNSTGI